MPPNAKPTVFISSTVTDLKKFREAAKDAAISAGFHPHMQEYFPARGGLLPEVLAKVSQADVLVAIIAHRYGTVPEDQPKGQCKSITWLECEHALAENKEVLPFFVDKDAPWDEAAKEEYELIKAVREDRAKQVVDEVQCKVKRLAEFKTWLGKRTIRVTFLNPEDLRGRVLQALFEWRGRHREFGSPELLTPEPDPARYLAALREETRHIEIRGLKAAEGRAYSFPIDDLYIPLVNEAAHGRGVEEADGPKPQMLEQALRSRRLVIVGDPGSGKSTFLRRIAQEICGWRLGISSAGALAGQLGLETPPFPILARVPELSESLAGRAVGMEQLIRALAAPLADYGLPGSFVRQQIEQGPCLLLLDGLDEATSEPAREALARLVARAANAWTNCRFVVTTRPQAYREDTVLAGFDEARIGALDADGVRVFLGRWSAALYAESPSKAEKHASELIHAVTSRPQIWQMARNPVMLTAVAVLHWNEKRMPEQRADLYESILGWLSTSRKRRPGRVSPERCLALLQELAWEMQTRREGRLVQAEREWAARMLAPRFREEASEEDRLQRARSFLAEEELDSGIVVRRGPDVQFWHLTFQEHLAAQVMGTLEEAERHRLLFAEGHAYSTEWREVVLLLAGLLHKSRAEKADALVSAALDALYRGSGWRGLLQKVGAAPLLRDRATCAILLGAILRDLQPLAYQPSDPRCDALVRSVLGIFDAQKSAGMPFRERLEAAKALGQAGDPRLREDNWITIPAGTFRMGAQKKDPIAPNYDPEAEDNEGPVRSVTLDAFQIGRYSVTVDEYKRFVKGNGYRDQRYWKDGGFGRKMLPDQWEEQLLHPNRPVAHVSWYESAAYCSWAGARLPSEAEWERAARGTEGRKYPWGNEAADPSRANYHETKAGALTPVGLFPRGATPEGIEDMAGNVWEWTADWYEKDVYRSVCGGSWYNGSWGLRAAVRDGSGPEGRVDDVGFRCVREVP